MIINAITNTIRPGDAITVVFVPPPDDIDALVLDVYDALVLDVYDALVLDVYDGNPKMMKIILDASGLVISYLRKIDGQWTLARWKDNVPVVIKKNVKEIEL